MTRSRCSRFRIWPAALLALVTIATTSSALAAPKKKGPKPKATDTTETAPAESSPPASADTAPAPAAEPAPSTTAAAASDATPAKGDAAADTKTPGEVDNTDTREDPNVRYYFVGLRYRATIIPQFIESLFVDEGRTVWSHTFGAELDMRKGGQSTIPWIVFTEYGMSDTLFHQKGATPTMVVGDAPNYSVVNSSLKAIYLGVDELWSTPIDSSHHWDFEYGFGVGIGFIFGDLVNNWVHLDPTNGPFQASNGNRYSKCQLPTDGIGCASMDHQGNPMPPKVGNYVEKNWFNGGSVPVIFPSISFPDVGVRYKPIKQFEARLHLGFSLTGFWFSLSGDYGLEKAEDKSVKASSSLARMRDML
jgi:hypothetical protein